MNLVACFLSDNRLFYQVTEKEKFFKELVIKYQTQAFKSGYTPVP